MCLEQGGYEHLYLPNEFEVDRRCVTHTKDGQELWRDPRTQEGELLWPAKVGPDGSRDAQAQAGQLRLLRAVSAAAEPERRRHLQEGMVPFLDVQDGARCRRCRSACRMARCSRSRPSFCPTSSTDRSRSWDMAFKDLQTSDYVAGGVWGAKGADRYLLDQVRDRLGFPETLQAVKAMTQEVARSQPEAGRGQGQRPGGDPVTASRDSGTGGGNARRRQDRKSAGRLPAGRERQRLSAPPGDRAVGRVVRSKSAPRSPMASTTTRWTR